MEQKNHFTECFAGDNAGVGSYLCQNCNYAVVGVQDSYTIPTCPCCEGVMFIAHELENQE